MIGCATIRNLLKFDVNRIYAIIQPNSKNRNRIPVDARIHIIECDCEAYSQLAETVQDNCDVFYHFAWIPSKILGRERYFDVKIAYDNIGQTLNALDVAHKLGCKVFVGAGSQAEYGTQRNEIQKPSDATNPVTAYAIAKDCCRRLCMLRAKEYGISVKWVRIFSIYGYNDRKNTLISQLLDQMKDNKTIELTKCEQIWEYLHEDDAGAALCYIGMNDIGEMSKIYCLGSGDARPLKQFVCEIKEIMNSSSELKFGELPYSPDTVMNLSADISELKNDTKWKGPKLSFREGIIEIISKM